jgi:hypothetical protein
MIAMTYRTLPTLLIATVLSTAATATELRSTPQQQTGLALTIYNDNLALVKDRRSLTLPTGENQLAFRGVSAMMRPETALLRNTDAPDKLNIVEQNFDFDLLTPQKMLEKYTGKQVQIARTNPATGEQTIEDAIVLSTHNGVVLQIGQRIEINPAGRYIFSDVPNNLRDKPTLSVQLNNQQQGQSNIELSYLTGGLGWKADYVAELSSDDQYLDLMGWVTLTNNSGTSYREAQLQLVAGDVNQVRVPATRKSRELQEMAYAARAKDTAMSQESLFEYHLYSLHRPTTINDRQTKQVSLLSASRIPVQKELLLQGSDYYYRSSYGDIGQRIKLGVFVQLDNEKKDGLGTPLPKGIVRVYKKDTKDNAQFIGEDRIDHTPDKDQVRLKLGDAFDVTADKKQTDFRIDERVMGRDVYESSFAITLNNAKTEPVTVVVREPVPGDWQISRESSPHQKVAAGTAQWHITVPAKSSETLRYTARIIF